LQHIKLEKQFGNFKIFQYEDIINNIEDEVKTLYSFTGISLTDQTRDFLVASQGKNIEDPYAVFKDKNVVSKWKTGLDAYIQEEIQSEVTGSELERFLA